MLRECIFHQPVIPCDTFRRLISCLTSTDVTQLYLHSVLSFNRSGTTRYFPKNQTFYFWMVVYSLACRCMYQRFRKDECSVHLGLLDQLGHALDTMAIA